MNNNRKWNMKAIGTVFLIILIILMFLSKTIYSYNLPAVTAVLPVNGKLNKSETAEGLADWAEEEEIYSELAGIIDEVLVREGDKIRKGQELFRLRYEEEDIKEKLKEIHINKNKIGVDMETIKLKMEKTETNIANLEEEIQKEEPEGTNELKKIENQMDKLKEQIKNAEEECEKQNILYDEGIISKSELDAAVNILKNLQYDLQGLRTDYENQNITVQQKVDAYQEKINGYRDNIEGFEHDLKISEQDLKTKELDLKNLTNQEEAYNRTLLDFDEKRSVKAPKNGTVILIPVKAGQYANANQLLISYGAGSEYKLECDISPDNNFVLVGDTCELTNTSHAADGVVSEINPEEHAKKVTVTFQSKEVTKGETFEIEFCKESTASYTLVPNGAVNQDNDGYFIYQVKKRKGVLGDEYYAEKVYVYIGDSDNENTVIVKGMDYFEPIVLLSDKPFSDDETIKVENEGDFFAEE